jgi:GT2 family glycosyltransferase
MLLSIVVINYNTFQLTCDCIRSIQSTTHVPHEIILVDNNSRECPAEKFLDVFPDVKLIALKENIGFGRANNRGVEEARGKYVLLLNSDTLVHEHTLDETVGYMEANPSVDILGCKVFTNGGAIQRTVYEYKGELGFFSAALLFVKRNSIMKELIRIGFNAWQKRKGKKNGQAVLASHPGGLINANAELTPNYHDGKRIGALNGVFLLLKRSVFVESKGFDPDFFMYDEETNWFLKRLRGYNMVYYPHASIMHFYGKSNVYNKMNLQHHVSQYLFWYKISVPHYLIFIIYNLLEIPSKALVSLLKWDKNLLSEVQTTFKAIPYVLFEIPRYPNRYGGRKEMLKLRSLRKRGL